MTVVVGILAFIFGFAAGIWWAVTLYKETE